jgi:hypothetical protein
MKQTDENMTGLKYASLGFFCIHSMLLTMKLLTMEISPLTRSNITNRENLQIKGA